MNKVKECIELASLAPTSSNMQLGNFIILLPRNNSEIATASFDQNAAKTAQQMVCSCSAKIYGDKGSNIDYLKHCTAKQLLTILKRKFALNYYQK
jgi:nitroreductase